MAKRETYIFIGHGRRGGGFGRFMKVTAIALAAVLLLLALLNFILQNRVTAQTEWVTVAKLPEVLEQYSILHLSDLHGASLGQEQAGFAQAVHGKAYSIVVMTGDMLPPDGDTKTLLKLIEKLPKTQPILYLPGDEDPDYLDQSAHDSASPYASWAERLIGAGVTILDEPFLVARGRNGADRIWFVPESLYTLNVDQFESTWSAQLRGLEAQGSLNAQEAARRRVCEYQVARARSIRDKLASMLPTDVQVCVSHTPLTEEYMRTMQRWSDRGTVFSIRQASLILAGHCCGGQFRLPGIGPVWVPELGWFPGDEGVRGWSWVGGVQQYISPGLGASGAWPPWMRFRLFNLPAVTTIYLTARIR